MFERRLKIFVGVLAGLSALLLLRFMHVQVVNAAHWRAKAAESMKRTQLLPAVRGSILDFKGRKLASDEPCIDAAVDFRAIERDPGWIKEEATRRLRGRAEGRYTAAGKLERGHMVQAEIAAVQSDLDGMWRELARVSGKSLDEIEQIKADIRRRVDMRRRSIWYTRYRLAMKKHDRGGDEPWYKEWILGEKPIPEIDRYFTEVSEQVEAHVILPAIPMPVHNDLKKRLERFPGLELRPSKHRVYARGASACHILGHLSVVTREEMENDPNVKDDPQERDDLRRYYINDLAGHGGVEELCEQALRGTRGQVERIAGEGQVLDTVPPKPGRNVRLSIDIELQQAIEEAFRHVEYVEKDGYREVIEMHGAAVVIDVPTGQIRAMVSYPTFDANRFEELYPSLAANKIDVPLLNRATQMALPPGSTAKPVVGIGAVSGGFFGINDTIECTGFLVIKGEPLESGRCWTASQFMGQLGREGVAHHKVPWRDPHPTGFLTLSDAIQRSCNVFFETLGDRMGLLALSKWFERFGLGHRTGVGLPESAGLIPSSCRDIRSLPHSTRWFSAIGQTVVLATPLQMANVAATIARDGRWVRPTLLIDEADRDEGPDEEQLPDVSLPVSQAAIAAVREGMDRVVNSEAGSGYDWIRRGDVRIAGKTGTAQSAPFALPKLGPDGQPLRDANKRIIYEEQAPSFPREPNPRMPWYRGQIKVEKGVSRKAPQPHAWFIGFAPARNPTVAWAVVLEYGGSGGHDAAPIANALLDACIKHGYLSTEK